MADQGFCKAIKYNLTALLEVFNLSTALLESLYFISLLLLMVGRSICPTLNYKSLRISGSNHVLSGYLARIVYVPESMNLKYKLLTERFLQDLKGFL